MEERIERLEQLLDRQEEPIRDYVELDSADDSDVWDRDEPTQQDKEAEDLDTQLVNVLLEVSEKYEQINPNSSSGIPIGDSCRLCSDRVDDKTVISIEERDAEEVSEIYKATIDRDLGGYFIDKDELDLEEKLAIVRALVRSWKKLMIFLDKQEKQSQSNSDWQKKQKEIAMVY